MRLLKFLVISSATAAWSGSQALCSAAVKSLDVQSFPPAPGEEVKTIEYTKEESAALFEHECSQAQRVPLVKSRNGVLAT